MSQEQLLQVLEELNLDTENLDLDKIFDDQDDEVRFLFLKYLQYFKTRRVVQFLFTYKKGRVFFQKLFVYFVFFKVVCTL